MIFEKNITIKDLSTELEKCEDKEELVKVNLHNSDLDKSLIYLSISNKRIKECDKCEGVGLLEVDKHPPFGEIYKTPCDKCEGYGKIDTEFLGDCENNYLGIYKLDNNNFPIKEG